MLQPEAEWHWALQHKVDSPFFTSKYEEENVYFAVGAVSWVGCYHTAVNSFLFLDFQLV
jgi:hypothetical protein